MDPRTFVLCALTLTIPTVSSFENNVGYNPYSRPTNYARSMPGLISADQRPPIYAPRFQPVRESESPLDDWSNNDAHGFHFGGELESRSLDSPLFSAIFNKPASTADLARFAQPRTFLPEQTFALTESAKSPPPVYEISQELGDYSSPYFRPVYARPPPPPTYPQKKLVKNVADSDENQCNCVCPSSTTISRLSTKTTTSPKTTSASTGKPTTTTEGPPTETQFSLDELTENSRLENSRPLNTLDFNVTTIEDLVNRAFNATRIVDHPKVEEDAETGENTNELSDINTSSTTEVSATSTTTTTLATTTTEKSDLKSRTGKRLSELSAPVRQFKTLQQKNRRTSLMDLAVPRGVLKI